MTIQNRIDWNLFRPRAWANWEAELDSGGPLYPPDGAGQYDGVQGEVFSRHYGSPRHYAGGWNALPTVARLAMLAQGELDRLPRDIRRQISKRYIQNVADAVNDPGALIFD